MKRLRFTFFSLLFLIGTTVFAQLTPEQKKQIEEAQKKAAEAQQKVKEMMNTPEMKKMMEQMKAQDALYEAERKKKKETKSRKQPQSNKKGESDFYWHNRITSNVEGKFKNWSFGNAEIRAGYRGQNRKWYEIKVGHISSNGEVTINFPRIDISTINPMSAFQHESEEVVGRKEADLKYSDKNVGYFSLRHALSVYKGNERLGALSIGNSVKPVVNLNSPCCVNYAGQGYMMYWVYVTQNNSISGTTKSTKHFGEITHNLNFKKGWNLVKMEVNGARRMDGQTDNQRYWKNKYVTTTTTLPSDAKYYFKSHLINSK